MNGPDTKLFRRFRRVGSGRGRRVGSFLWLGQTPLFLALHREIVAIAIARIAAAGENRADEEDEYEQGENIIHERPRRVSRISSIGFKNLSFLIAQLVTVVKSRKLHTGMCMFGLGDGDSAGQEGRLPAVSPRASRPGLLLSA